jgi:hypothetical protein
LEPGVPVVTVTVALYTNWAILKLTPMEIEMDDNQTPEMRHEEVLELIEMILNTAGVNANPKIFSAICQLDAAICEALGLDVKVHAMADSITPTE